MSTLPQTQDQTIQDAWDYKGNPAERSKTGGWTSSAMILGTCFGSIIFLLLLISLVSYISYSFFRFIE
jgi:peptide/histidine transporter 3/4